MINEADKLGKAPLGKLIFSMCGYAGLALLTYSIYNLADTLFIAWGVNAYAAGAVSVTFPLMLILGAVSTTVGAGGASLISRALGKRDTGLAANIAANVFLLFWIFAVIVTALGLIFLEPLLRLLGATGELLPYAREYAFIILAGAITSTGFSSLIRAEGAARFALYIWIVPVGINILLDALFIFTLKMGVAGAALATVIAQLVSVCMSIWFFFFRRNRAYNITISSFRLRLHLLGEIGAIGFPSLASQLSSSILVIALNRVLAYIGGEAAITALGFAVRIQTFLLLPQNGIVQGIQPIIGYNHAQGANGRVRKTLLIAAITSAIYGITVCTFGIIFRNALLSLFTVEPDIYMTGTTAIIFLLMTAPIKGYSSLISTYFQAVGNIKNALALPLIGICVFRIPLLLVLGYTNNLNGVFWSFPVSEICIFILALILIKHVKIQIEKEDISDEK